MIDCILSPRPHPHPLYWCGWGGGSRSGADFDEEGLDHQAVPEYEIQEAGLGLLLSHLLFERRAHFRRNGLRLLAQFVVVVGEAGRDDLLEQVGAVAGGGHSQHHHFADADQRFEDGEDAGVVANARVDLMDETVAQRMATVVHPEFVLGHEILGRFPLADLGEHLRLGRDDVGLDHLLEQVRDVVLADPALIEELIDTPLSELLVVDQTIHFAAVDQDVAAPDAQRGEQGVAITLELRHRTLLSEHSCRNGMPLSVLVV